MHIKEKIIKAYNNQSVNYKFSNDFSREKLTLNLADTLNKNVTNGCSQIIAARHKNSVSFYLGMAMIGAINTVFIYPYAFEDNPEYFGLIQVIIAYSLLVATITTVGVPKVFTRFFPEIKSKSQLYFFSLITPLIGSRFSSSVLVLFI